MHPGLSLVYHSQQNRSGSDTAAQKAAFRPAHCTARFGQGLWFPRTRPALLRAGVLPQTDQIRWLASGGFVPESRGCQCPVILPGACPLAQAPLLGSWPLALSDSDPPQLSVEPAYPGWGSSCYLSQATKLSSSCTFAWPYILCWLVIDPNATPGLDEFLPFLLSLIFDPRLSFNHTLKLQLRKCKGPWSTSPPG